MKNIILLSIILPIFIGCGSTSTIDTDTKPNNTDNINRIDTAHDDVSSVNIPTSDVYINEFLTRNIDTNMDEFYQFSNWIELYNRSDEDIDISNYKLSDGDNKEAWSIPAGTTIKAKDYKIIWVDKENIDLHTNFSLSSKGESILLYNNDNELIDKIKYKKQKRNISYGRNRSLTSWGFMLPTFNKKNHDVLKNPKRVNQPNFQLSNNKTTVTITTSDDSEIYYTTDGSTPTAKSFHYTQPFNMSKTTVLKALSYKDNFLPSKIKTVTYFQSEESINLPKISLSMDNKYLYNNIIGIYTSGTNGKIGEGCYAHRNDGEEGYRNFNQDWKRPVFIEYFEKDGSKAFDLGSDISIGGQCSRYRSKKSFSLKMHGKYGHKSTKYAFYTDKPNIKKVKSFKIRTGLDGHGVEDVLAAALAKDGNFDIEYQSYKTIQMFMNGEYWGIYTIREKKGKNFLKTNHPEIDKDKVDVIAHTFHGDVIKKGNKQAFDKLDNYVSNHNLSLDSNYNTIKTMIDENNFIDYMAFMIYSGNHDWLNNNTRVWRERKEGAKWRWMLDDLDNAFLNPNLDTVKFAKSSYTFLTRLFNNLLKNRTFKQKFKDRFNHYLNTTFAEENMLKIINKVTNERKAYIRFEKLEWHVNTDAFSQDIEKFKTFAQRRVSIIRNQLNQL